MHRLGNRGSELTAPVPESQHGSPPGGCGAAGGGLGGDGPLPQPERDILAGMLPLGSICWPLYPSLCKQTIRGADLGCAWRRRAHMKSLVPGGSDGCAPRPGLPARWGVGCVLGGQDGVGTGGPPQC